MGMGLQNRGSAGLIEGHGATGAVASNIVIAALRVTTVIGIENLLLTRYLMNLCSFDPHS